jgi:hypothetical protein
VPVSPNGHPYDTRYSIGYLPAGNDPGWGDWRHKSDGQMVRMINVHGPFDVDTGEGMALAHCEDGWLALAEQGLPYPIDAAAQARDYEEVT